MKTKQQLLLHVSEEFAGQRLDRFLTSSSEIISRSFAQDLILKELVRVNGNLARSSFVLKLNQVVEVNLPETAPTELIPYDYRLDIVYEDDDLLVVNKPSGLVVHPAAGHEQDTLVNALIHHTKNLSMKNEERPGIVHRLDKETSGLLVVAKNDFSHEKLAQQFKDKSTHRIYFALVTGTLAKKNGLFQSYLARHPNDRKRYASIKINNKIMTNFDVNFDLGKWAVTRFERIELSSKMTYVKLKLETGRTHQIRVHLSEAGHCLVGDVTYGFNVQKAKSEGLSRFFLHAAELGFKHPKTQEDMFFKSPWPKIDEEKIKSYGFKLV